MTNLLLVGDNPEDGVGVRPSFGYWLTILGVLGDRPLDGIACPVDYKWPASVWWMTDLLMVGDYPRYGGWTLWDGG